MATRKRRSEEAPPGAALEQPPPDAGPSHSADAESEIRQATGDEQFGTIDEFFREVAAGVVKAQQDLDGMSDAYLRSRNPVAAPSVFRIPRVTAEFSLAAEKIGERKIGFLVSARSERRDAMQQKLSFEIISVPPMEDARTESAEGVLPSTAADDTEAASQEADAETAAEAGTAEADNTASGSLTLADILNALKNVRDRSDTKYREEEIAQQLIDNWRRWTRLDHPTHVILLFSPPSDAEPGTDLVMALIDQSTHAAEVYTTVKAHTDENRRFQIIVERLAELAAR